MNMKKCEKNSFKPVIASENNRKWAEKYIQDVAEGKIIVCKWVKLAIKRHISDIKKQKQYYFDPEAGETAIKAFNEYRHFEGKWAGCPFIMLPWQQAITYILFGWKVKKTGLRRFRTAYIEVARKNGKTFWAAGIGLYMLDMDGESAAQVYSAATQRDQAKIVHEAAKQIIRQSHYLKKYAKIYRNSIAIEDTVSVFKPLSSESNTLDGLNVSCAIIDEYHAHKNRELYEVLNTATGAREQPLLLIITTAGYEMKSACRDMHDYVENILRGVIKDERLFGIIYTLDDGDDWTDSKVYVKSNPSLGTALDIEELKDRCITAKNDSSALNDFLVKRMNVWTSSSVAWISYEDWCASAGKVDEQALLGRRCYLGADLSAVSDISSVCAIFPWEDGSVKAIWRYYLPEDGIEKKCLRDRAEYDQWARDGYITLTPGRSIDYDFIERDILRFAKDYQVLELAEDPYNATQLTNHLINEGITCIDMRQGFLSMSPPTKGLQRTILEGKFHHGNNPVTNWMINNCEVITDPAGNVKLDKAARVSRRKIDGIIAAIMAYSRIDAEPVPGPSIYETRGVVSI